MTKNPVPEHDYRAWLEKVEEDSKSAQILLEQNAPPSAACFWSQQIAEKALKALLLYANRKFPKVHDLLELETLLLRFYPDIQKFHEDLTLLNRCYTETRYAGDYPEFTPIECAQAYEAAIRVKEFVLGKIS